MVRRLTAGVLCAALGLWAAAPGVARGQVARHGLARPVARLAQNRTEKDSKKPSGFGAKTDRPAISGFGSGEKKAAAESPPEDRGRERNREDRPRERRREDRPTREDRPRENRPREEGGSRESGGGGGNDDQAKIRRYAQSLLSRYDQNKNGVLEREEWQGKMSGEPEKADANGDGRITLDELTARLGNYGKERGGSSADSSAPARRDPPGRPREPDGPPGGDESPRRDDAPPEPAGPRRPSEPSGSYASGGGGDYAPASRSGRSGGKARRFLTPTERLPEGLPSFFARCDADGDGQVSMAEFASGWSEAKAAEFSKYDTNGDGVITPAEALAAEKKRN